MLSNERDISDGLRNWVLYNINFSELDSTVFLKILLISSKQFIINMHVWKLLSSANANVYIYLRWYRHSQLNF